MPDGVEDPVVSKVDVSRIPLAFRVVSGVDDTSFGGPASAQGPSPRLAPATARG